MSTVTSASSKLNNGSYGELITAHKTPVIQIDNKYKINPVNRNDLEVFTATGGTVSNNGNLFQCKTGVSVGGYGVVRTKETINYRAGQSIECIISAKFTTGVANSLQFAGLFNLTETVAVGYNGAAFSALHSHNGAADVHVIEVTGSPSVGEDCTVTLDDDSAIISLTNSTQDENADQIRKGLEADVTINGKWRFDQVGAKVFCIAKVTAVKAGAFSFSSATAVATVTGLTTGAAKTDNHQAIATPFVGFDPTQLNVYRILYGYLGTSNITFEVYNPNTSKFELMATVKWANANTTAHTGLPNFKVGYTAASLGSTTDLTVEGASSGVFYIGDESPKEKPISDINTTDPVGATLVNLLTLKNAVIYNNQYNLGKVKPTDVFVENENTKAGIVEIIKNADIAGVQNYTYKDEYNSIVLLEKTSGAVTNGELLVSFPVPANDARGIDLQKYVSNLLPGETLTVAGLETAGASGIMRSFVNWSEVK